MTTSEGQSWVISGENARAFAQDAGEVVNLPNVRLIVRKHGDDVSVQWAAEGYQGPPQNDSHPCPGSPGCP